jgi:hypothetical protein
MHLSVDIAQLRPACRCRAWVLETKTAGGRPASLPPGIQKIGSTI